MALYNRLQRLSIKQRLDIKMNPEILLQAFEHRVAEKHIPDARLTGEVIVQGNRAEIIFRPEVPVTDEDLLARNAVKGAIHEACVGSEPGRLTEVDPMLGHIGLSGVTDEDLNAINGLPGVFLARTAA
jgi:hypothetical protein